MDIFDAARRAADLLAAKVAGEADVARLRRAAESDDDFAGWAAREAARHPAGAEALRELASSADGPGRAAAVAAELIRRAAADRDFAAELIRRASSPAPVPTPAPAALRQLVTVTDSGVGMNVGGDLGAKDVRIAGRDDNSSRNRLTGDGATAVQNQVTHITGDDARVHVGNRVVKRKFFLVPLAYFGRIGRSAGSAASAHPAVAAAACTIVVAGGVVGAVALNQSPPPSLSAAPVSFSGLWQGTITEPGKSPYPADVAITGGPLNGTVGSINLTSLPCTSALTLTSAQAQQLTANDATTSGSCSSGTLVLIPDGAMLHYTLTSTSGVVATGVLTRVQSFNSAAATPSSPALSSTESSGRVVVVPLKGAADGQPLLGPDGRVWLVSTGTNALGLVEAVDPGTDAVSTYRFNFSVPNAKVSYSTQAAFDGSGNLWIGAVSSAGGQDSPFLLRYTPGSGSLSRFALSGSCSAPQGETPEDLINVYGATDGAVWAVCPANDNNPGAFAVLERFTAAGQSAELQSREYDPGTAHELWVALTDVSITSQPPAQGPDGTLAGIAGGSTYVEVAASGKPTDVPIQLDGSNIVPDQIFGNAAALDVTATCPADGPKACIGSLAQDGTITPIATIPGFTGANASGLGMPTLDKAGNVWMLIAGSGNGASPGQYYFEVTPRGTTHTFPITVAGDFGKSISDDYIFEPHPVITSNGEVWLPDTNNGNSLVGFLPASS